MKHLLRSIVSLVVPALMLSGVAANPAFAQDKAKAAPAAKAEKGKSTLKELIENDKVRVFEVRFKPGFETAASAARPARVIRALNAGTMTAIYPDGKTEKREYKTGEVKYFGADAVEYKLKNLGKTDLVLFVVFLKEPKK